MAIMVHKLNCYSTKKAPVYNIKDNHFRCFVLLMTHRRNSFYDLLQCLLGIKTAKYKMKRLCIAKKNVMELQCRNGGRIIFTALITLEVMI